jgi:hypothetical protein
MLCVVLSALSSSMGLPRQSVGRGANVVTCGERPVVSEVELSRTSLPPRLVLH